MNEYQIIVKEAGSNRWVFAAHGAAYTEAEAKAYKARAIGRKASVKLLSVRVEAERAKP